MGIEVALIIGGVAFMYYCCVGYCAWKVWSSTV
jgi:hypothetical protein